MQLPSTMEKWRHAARDKKAVLEARKPNFFHNLFDKKQKSPAAADEAAVERSDKIDGIKRLTTEKLAAKGEKKAVKKVAEEDKKKKKDKKAAKREEEGPGKRDEDENDEESSLTALKKAALKAPTSAQKSKKINQYKKAKKLNEGARHSAKAAKAAKADRQKKHKSQKSGKPAQYKVGSKRPGVIFAAKPARKKAAKHA